MSHYSVVKLIFDSSGKDDLEVDILGNYVTNILALEKIMDDIEAIKKGSKMEVYESIIVSDTCIHLIKRHIGYIYSNKELYVQYHIKNISSDILEQ